MHKIGGTVGDSGIGGFADVDQDQAHQKKMDLSSANGKASHREAAETSMQIPEDGEIDLEMMLRMDSNQIRRLSEMEKMGSRSSEMEKD